MKRRVESILLSVVLIAILLGAMGCAGVGEKWKALTPDQKARIVIGDIQDQLSTAFDTAKAQIGHKPEWKTKVVPAFSTANKALADVITLGKAQPLTPALVYEKVQNQVNNVLNLCIQLGWVKK